MTQTMTATKAAKTTPPAISGIGWSHGIASQVSLPNISTGSFRTDLRGGVADIRPRRRRDLPRRHGLKESRIDRAKRVGLYILALLRELGIAGAVEGRAILACRRRP